LTVTAKVEKLTGARVVFNYEVTRDKDHVLIATGFTMHAFTDSDIRVLNILKTHRHIYDILCAALSD